MKKIYFIAAATMAAGLLSSCSSDYLEYKPDTDISSDKLTDPSVAQSMMEGVYLAMNTQYTDLEWNQNVGEAQINITNGDAGGADLTCYLFNDDMNNWSYMMQSNSYIVAYPWNYFYNIINLSNYLITNIEATSDNTEGTEPSLLSIKAQALTMRAHGYVRLLWYFGQRWEDSDNGEAYCFPLRTSNTQEPMPLSKMNDVLALIYEDCDEAIKLFAASGIARTNMWECNAQVAHGEWARAALLKHDWAKAAEEAKAAREGVTVMSEDEMLAGFYTNNSATIWSMADYQEYPYYWSWGARFACNGQYINNWGVGSAAINIDLYNKLDANDSRRKMFWTPDKISEVPTRYNRARMKAEDFWNPKVVSESSFLNMNISDAYKTGGTSMYNCVAWWLYNYYENVFTGNKADIEVPENTDNMRNFFTIMPKLENSNKDVVVGSDANDNPVIVRLCAIPFGAAMKFWAKPTYGIMAFPWMRAEEMVLTEAEAEYMQGHETQAKAALTEVQSKRISGYTCSTSGDALLDEIRTCRRIELWGEGFAFSDLKRWNMPRVRRAWKANDPTSGSIPPVQTAGYTEEGLQAIQSPAYCNGWRYTIPQGEMNYNHAIDQSLLKKFE